MRFALVTIGIMALLFVACGGSTKPTSETSPESTPTKAPAPTEPTPTAAPATPESPENTLIETPEYTGVIISENGVAEFSYLFGGDTAFWEPLVDDVSRAEACIKEYLGSVQDDPNLDSYQQENLSFILGNLGDYRRQYVGFVVDGEKRIWCNAFRSDSFPDWERVPVDVDGGGRNFWQIEYDPLKDECTDFVVHGES